MSQRRPGFAVLALLVVVAAGVLAEPRPHAAMAPPVSQPNVVLIVTDDQRWDTLQMMPNVRTLLGDEGVTFENAFVTNALCCPSRASILTGQTTHTHGVWTNAPPYGIDAFDASDTIATRLQAAGYRTAIVGKYFNNYSRSDGIAPGWDRWSVEESEEQPQYYNYSMNMNGTMRTWGDRDRDYATTVMGRLAASFLWSTTDPFFLYWAPIAPHEPATPAPRDKEAGKNIEPARPANYNEADVSDKPAWLQATPKLGPAARKDVDAFRRRQLVSLKSVDREIGTLVEALESREILDETLIIFMSDNGMSLGEHRWKGKLVPYDESIRVPLVIRYDPLVAGADRVEEKLVSNIDIAPTIADLAGVSLDAPDGTSLQPLLANPNTAWRDDVLIDHEAHGTVPSYCAVRSKDHLYVLWSTGEEELYDLDADPMELDNIAGAPGQVGKTTQMHDRALELCDPLPPTWSTP